MAALNILTICYACQEETTTYSCPGCLNYFCFDRESLKLQFHEIEDQRNDFMQILNDHTINIHPLISQINHWEQMSIDKIRQTANVQREFIQQIIHEHSQRIHIELNIFTEDMQKIAKRKDFNEMTLNKLRTQLETLKKQLNPPTHIQIKEDSASAYINKLSILMNLKQGIYVADCNNHRIIKWKLGEKDGGNDCGIGINQLNEPTDVIVDKNSTSLIICDNGNRRIVRWSLENPEDREIIIEDINCWGLTMNENGDLSVSDRDNQAVKRWRKGTIVAGGHGRGNKLNQLYNPVFIFIDREDTLYITDSDNHRVIKWRKDAKEGIVVADGKESNQFKHPVGLSFDAENNLYVVDQSTI